MVDKTIGQVMCIPEERVQELVKMMGEKLEGQKKEHGILDLIAEAEDEKYAINEVLFMGAMLGRIL
jgi:hypothetical protein